MIGVSILAGHLSQRTGDIERADTAISRTSYHQSVIFAAARELAYGIDEPLSNSDPDSELKRGSVLW